MTSSIVGAYETAKRRLLLLDYDGTLTPIVSRPEEARPSVTLLELLRKLCADKRNTVVIVSGRKKEEINAWLGTLPVAIVAEHGTWQKTKRGSWKLIHEADTTWKPKARQIMEKLSRILPGSFVEEKHANLVFHYRLSESEDAEVQVSGLLEELRDIFPDLKVSRGKKIVEIIDPHFTKGAAAIHWYGFDMFDFVLAMGDDTTDEDMFIALPDNAYTIHVGNGETQANVSLAEQKDAVELLKQFISQ